MRVQLERCGTRPGAFQGHIDSAEANQFENSGGPVHVRNGLQYEIRRLKSFAGNLQWHDGVLESHGARGDPDPAVVQSSNEAFIAQFQARTDLSMPGMSGLDLATELKRLHPDLPVVLLSGWAMQELEEKVKDAGIDYILGKPCLMEDMLRVVQQAARTPIAS